MNTTTTTAPAPTTTAQATRLAALADLGLTPEQTAAVAALLATRKTAPKAPGACGCGCGAPTQRRFAIGHDAKLKGRLLAAWRKGEAVADAPAHAGTTDPLEALKALGWGHFAVELAPRKPAAAKAAAAPIAKAQQPAREDASAKARAAQAELEAEAVAKAERKARKAS